MAMLEDMYSNSIWIAQEISRNPQVQSMVFADAVDNIYRLLSVPEGHWLANAKKEADIEYARLKETKAKRKAEIETEVKRMDEEYQDYQRAVKREKAEWDIYRIFLAALMRIGHKYDLIPTLRKA